MKKSKPTRGRKPILDEFTPLKVSRQRKWQLRRAKAGLCAKCNNPVAPGQEMCVKHKIEQALAWQKKRNSPRPSKGKWVDLANLPLPATKPKRPRRAKP